ncbi:aspartate aminotransferase family protein [Bermanella marisrubri]|uniref:Acetylornithine aminotransferase n=1 Tax=Bermanella marisrubri TaxID=207949 RepID=Q1MZU8_9GAMM|nr:aspartate aminotransferase family protein [Bermanella marisrubri]EAT11459.1 bifunctional N-succinyldiaminopimelate-aminotransferase/acetylornithine transaminase protein [Oceanobacter sp. RED65] [Bermanella marisrubri]QIZ85037.1 aspartate aminotransferase family protein [Bermanella marisrubri]
MSVQRSLFDEVMVPTYNPPEIIPVSGKGSRVWDQEGREYIDFAGGIAVNCLGHCHPDVVEALQEQSQKLWHLSNVMTNEPALNLAKSLTEKTFADRVYFANSGAEANEAAFKLVRRYAIEQHGEDKTKIISFTRAFHGRTFFAVTVGGQEAYSAGFGPRPGNIVHCDFNDIEQFKALIDDDTCAVIMEPIQGEGGIIEADPHFAHEVRKLCDQHKALLVFDEVQTGVGRTGSLYAYESLGVEPDVLTTAKALGAGFPIAAMLTKEHIAACFKAGVHGSTYGGNPLACAVGLKVLDIVSDPKLLEQVTVKSERLKEGLKTIGERYDVFSDVRGKGLLIGAELKPEFHGKARELLNHGLQQGVMCLVAGPNILRLTPSLIIPDKDIDEGLTRLDAAVKCMVSV